MFNIHRALLLVCVAILAGCTPAKDIRTAPAPGSHYVAMGSSFASGPGILPRADGPARCGQSENNYARTLARMADLDITDVTCSGARTTHILGPWRELPAQLDAIRPETQLVTITIGGNDIGYIGGLINASCAFAAAQLPEAQRAAARPCRPVALPTAEDYAGVEERMTSIVSAVRSRAPQARIIFVDYVSVLPAAELCTQTPLSPEEAETFRNIARKLEAITARAARASGAEILSAATLTRAHHACAAASWMQGYTPGADFRTQVPYHPTKEGMIAIAETLADTLTLRR